MSELKHELPPGPPLPGVLHTLVAAGTIVSGSFRLGALEPLRKRYGDIFTVHFPTLGKAVMVGNPELVKQVFMADKDTLYAGSQSPLGNVLGRNSLLAIDGDHHMEQRKLVLPPFHGERMHAYEAVVEEEALREIESWPEGQELKTLRPMMRITLEVIMRTVFGVEGSELEEVRDDLRERVPRSVVLGSKLAAFPFLHHELGGRTPWGEFMGHRRHFNEQISSLVQRARRDPNLAERTDVLALFAQATHADDGTPMTDAEIQDQLMTIIAAGHETTATTLAWTFERLRRHPELVERLREEADAGGKELREATIREVQRVRPVIIGVGREVRKPFELGGYVLPPGVVIAVPAGLLHLNPRLYTNPRRFDPDRFVGVKPSPYEWIPFGGGIRRCPGAAFAHMEMDIVLRTVLRSLELKPTTARGERWSFRGVAFAPRGGGLAAFSRRSARRRPAAHAAAAA